jgi:hypothetical protein
MLQPCSGGPASHLTSNDTREETDMYPGPNDTDWEVAKFQHRERVTIGMHQQLAASALASAPAASVYRDPESTRIRQLLGTLLVRAGQRLQGTQALTRTGSVSTATGELGAIA